jgi:DNA repair protein RadC
VWFRFTGNPPAQKLEMIMRKVTKSLQNRPDSGRLVIKTDVYSTGLIRETDGAYLAVSDEAVIETALQILAQQVSKGSVMSSPTAVKNYLRLRFSDLQHEVVFILYLDRRHRLIDCEELFRGTIDGASVHPREVVKSALRHNAAALVMVHNHPSNCAEPSRADELITQRVKAALLLVDIQLIDHIVACGSGAISMAERGLI